MTILWDFDGVLLDSNRVRDLGFREVLREYPQEQVDALIDYHHRNGGLSRYVKFRHFFEVIRGEALSEENLVSLTAAFSSIMRRLLTDPGLLIPETVNFVKANYRNIRMHVVSGSDQEELRFLCRELGLSPYFISIHGSPTPKKNLVALVLDTYGYLPGDCLLIGDSINDYEAAAAHGVPFQAYNNADLEKYNTPIPIALC